jgi:sugar phosphate isomerase/epimerase
MELVMFSKMLKNIGGLDVEAAGSYIVKMGFDGVDLTVRPGGHILPGVVREELPRAIEILRLKGLSVPMITTSVTNAEEEHAEEIFKTASECGVRFIKLGYWRYAGFGTIKKQIEQVRSRDLRGICKLSEEYGVTAGLHIHSGDFLTSNPVVVHLLLEGYDPRSLCAYIDPGHMAVEGGLSGWKIGLDILQEHVRMVAVKDYGWFRQVDGETGEVRWEARTVPLSEGLVPWEEVFRILKRIGFDGPVSIHSEYHDVDFRGLIRRTEADLRYLREVLKRLGIA